VEHLGQCGAIYHGTVLKLPSARRAPARASNQPQDSTGQPVGMERIPPRYHATGAKRSKAAFRAHALPLCSTVIGFEASMFVALQTNSER
jgi:hypothetical protein